MSIFRSLFKSRDKPQSLFTVVRIIASPMCGGYITIRDLDHLTIVLVMDMWTEKGNDDVTYYRVEGQEEFDNF